MVSFGGSLVGRVFKEYFCGNVGNILCVYIYVGYMDVFILGKYIGYLYLWFVYCEFFWMYVIF